MFSSSLSFKFKLGGKCHFASKVVLLVCEINTNILIFFMLNKNFYFDISQIILKFVELAPEKKTKK